MYGGKRKTKINRKKDKKKLKQAKKLRRTRRSHRGGGNFVRFKKLIQSMFIIF